MMEVEFGWLRGGNPDRCSEIRCSEDDLLAPKQRAAQSIEQDSEP